MVRKAGGCLCWSFTRTLLDERLNTVLSGGTPRKADLRNFFYEVRNRFLKANPELMELDTDAQNVYAKFEDVIKNWCMDKGPLFGVEPELYWRVREKLNLWATGKAICWKNNDIFPILTETRQRVLEGCSFVLVCEKRTVGDELLKKLTAAGYHLNIVATVGHSQSDVQEVILAVEDAIEDEQNFYVLILHDFDLDGVRIYQTLKQRHPGIIDVGVNGEFFEWLKRNGDFDPRLLEERCLNKKYQRDLKECLESDDGYTAEDFNYLQGTQTDRLRWEGHRIEIDAIHAAHGIQPFIDYMLYKIQKECKVWDLSKIGLNEFTLSDPANQYKATLDAYLNDIKTAIIDKFEELTEPRENIIKIIKQTNYGDLTTWRTIKNKIWSPVTDDPFILLTHEEILKTNASYKDAENTDYTEPHQDDLNDLNGNVTFYEGDVRKGIQDLTDQFDELQDSVYYDAENDPHLEEYQNELDEIDWGEDQLSEIEPVSEVELIDRVIEALRERRAQLMEAVR